MWALLHAFMFGTCNNRRYDNERQLLSAFLSCLTDEASWFSFLKHVHNVASFTGYSLAKFKFGDKWSYCMLRTVGTGHQGTNQEPPSL